MKASEVDRKQVLWVMPDNAREHTPVQGLIKNVAFEQSRSGKEHPVVTLDCTGREIKVSKWRLRWDGCVNAWGDDTDSWKGKLVELAQHPNRTDLVITPLLENVK